MTTALAMPPKETADAYGSEISKALPVVLTMRAVDASSSEACSSALRDIVTRRKQIDDERLKATGPINAALRTINGWFKPVDTRFAEAETHLRGEVGRYALATEQARRAAMIEATRGAPAPVDPIPQHADAQGVSTPLVWKWRIVDPNLVPRELCSPDLNKIQAHMNHAEHIAGAKGLVPGVEWYEEARVIARKRT